MTRLKDRICVYGCHVQGEEADLMGRTFGLDFVCHEHAGRYAREKAAVGVGAATRGFDGDEGRAMAKAAFRTRVMRIVAEVQREERAREEADAER